MYSLPWSVTIYTSYRQSHISPTISPGSKKLDYSYDEYLAEYDIALIQYFVQLLLDYVITVLPSSHFGIMPEFSATRIATFRARTYTCIDSVITRPQKVVQEPLVSLLTMLFLELSILIQKIKIVCFRYLLRNITSLMKSLVTHTKLMYKKLFKITMILYYF